MFQQGGQGNNPFNSNQQRPNNMFQNQGGNQGWSNMWNQQRPGTGNNIFSNQQEGQR